MKVVYIKDSYPEKRTIINKIDGIKYKKISNFNNLYKYVNFINRKILKGKSINSEFKFKSIFKIEKNNLFHFFNDINIGNEDYITTFETCIPRIDMFMNNFNDDKKKNLNKISKQLNILTKKNCKALIAISEASKNIQLNLLEYCSNEDRKIIKNKIHVIHPPQQSIFENYYEKKKFLFEDLTFVFVGRDFYRKGGYEITMTFDKLVKKFPNEKIKLILVGDIENTWDYTKKISEAEVYQIKHIINNNNNIKLYKDIDNYKVIELLKKSHVGLLNTWADTYGYSVLEMQANGCPVITTNVRALPEINNNDCGWIINLPLTSLREADYFNEISRKRIREIILTELEEIMTSIIQNKDIIEKKGTSALKRIKEEHDPQEYSLKLEKLYREKYNV